MLERMHRPILLHSHCPHTQAADAKSQVAQLQASVTERNKQVSNLESALTKKKQEDEQLKYQVCVYMLAQ